MCWTSIMCKSNLFATKPVGLRRHLLYILLHTCTMYIYVYIYIHIYICTYYMTYTILPWVPFGFIFAKYQAGLKRWACCAGAFSTGRPFLSTGGMAAGNRKPRRGILSSHHGFQDDVMIKRLDDLWEIPKFAGWFISWKIPSNKWMMTGNKPPLA